MLFKVKVIYYCNVYGKEIEEYAIFPANSYTECIKMIVGRYGENELTEMSAKWISPDECITFDKEHRYEFENLCDTIEGNAIW